MLVLLVNAAIAAIIVIATLYTLAKKMASETQLHRLRIDALRLREEYAERLAALRRGPDAEAPIEMVEIVGEPATASDTEASSGAADAPPARAAA